MHTDSTTLALVPTTSTTNVTRSLASHIDAMSAIVLDGVSDRTAREYRRALNDFMVWFWNTGQREFNKAAVQAHVSSLKAKGVTPSSINQRLAAIRKLALELADNGVIEEQAAQAVRRVENIKIHGGKMGNWLSPEQAKSMIAAADDATLVGKRDRAILAVMLGCGLRREELTTLTIEHLQQRDGRWVILDLKGKHNRTRTIPMAAWVKATIDKWTAAAGIDDGYLWPPMRKGGKLQPGHLSSQAIWKVVQRYSPVEKLAPHDLRRTFAKLAHKAGAPMEQIQFSLGHASIQTTERYVGADLDLAHAPSDYIASLV